MRQQIQETSLLFAVAAVTVHLLCHLSVIFSICGGMVQQRLQTDTLNTYSSPEPMKPSSTLFAYVTNSATFVWVHISCEIIA